MNKFVDSPLYLDGFNSIFHLKQSTFRREGINSPIVLGPFDKTFENKYFLSNRIYVDNQKGENPKQKNPPKKKKSLPREEHYGFDYSRSSDSI